MPLTVRVFAVVSAATAPDEPSAVKIYTDRSNYCVCNKSSLKGVLSYLNSAGL